MKQVHDAGADKAIFTCPSTSFTSWAGGTAENGVAYYTPLGFFGLSIGRAKRPTKQVIVLDRGDCTSYYATIPNLYDGVPYGISTTIHDGYVNCGFIDGHAEALQASTIPGDYSRFLND